MIGLQFDQFSDRVGLLILVDNVVVRAAHQDQIIVMPPIIVSLRAIVSSTGGVLTFDMAYLAFRAVVIR
jgi:hypothetical protein